LLSPPRGAVDRHESSIEVRCIERKAKRAARALKLTREDVALEVHQKDHVVSRGERPSSKLETFEALEAGADNQHVGIDGDDPLEMSGQDIVEKQATEHCAGKAASPREISVEA